MGVVILTFKKGFLYLLSCLLFGEMVMKLSEKHHLGVGI